MKLTGCTALLMCRGSNGFSFSPPCSHHRTTTTERHWVSSVFFHTAEKITVADFPFIVRSQRSLALSFPFPSSGLCLFVLTPLEWTWHRLSSAHSHVRNRTHTFDRALQSTQEKVTWTNTTMCSPSSHTAFLWLLSAFCSFPYFGLLFRPLLILIHQTQRALLFSLFYFL